MDIKIILGYAEGLYSKALSKMNLEQFRMADIYALSAHSAASFVAAQEELPKAMRGKAIDLEDAAWQLSKQAYAGTRMKLVAPRLSGAEDIGLEEIRYDIFDTASKASRGGKRRA